jgi:ABC-type multidrug transport system fused ATPase/permease subunit
VIVDGLIEIKSFGKEKFFQEQVKRANQSYSRTLIQDQSWQSGTTRLTEVIVAFLICMLAGYVVFTQQPRDQALLLLGVYAGACFRIIPSINRMMLAVHQIRTHDYVLRDLDVAEQAPALPVDQPMPAMKQSIGLIDVTFGYPGQPLLLQKATFSVQRGQCIAITGNSGEGKTTILHLLMRFLEPSGGEILCDGQRVSEFGSWGGQICYVPQNPYLLNASIAENIAFGIPTDAIDRKKVKDLLEIMHLSDLVAGLPAGMDSVIGEQGSRVSGGQRQRLAIARALYHDAGILLLDEVTNQVQPRLELEILEAMSSLALSGKTIITVTHTLSFPGYFDAVYRLENGKLTAVATERSPTIS